MTLASLNVPLAMCAVTTTECVWTETLMYKNDAVVEWLVRNDRQLLEQTVTHNETRKALCR